MKKEIFLSGMFSKNTIKEIFVVVIGLIIFFPMSVMAQLKGGTGKMDINDYQVLNNDPLYVKALALDDGTT
jgi:hypothetical protein